MEIRISLVIPHPSSHVEQSLHTPVFFLVTKLVFAHLSVVQDRRQHRDAQGHPYHCSIQMGAKEQTRREGLCPPDTRIGGSGAARLLQPLLLLYSHSSLSLSSLLPRVEQNIARSCKIGDKETKWNSECLHYAGWV